MDFTKIKIDDSFSLGEKSRIRRIDFGRPEEYSRLKDIVNDPEAAEFLEDLQMSDEQILEYERVEENNICIAVVGKEGVVPQEEVNKLQGWIYFYPDEEERLFRLKEKGILGGSFAGLDVIEISYARHPRAVPGQMSSGLRQMIKILSRKCTTTGEMIVLSAYTDRKNVSSSRLLASCGFSNIGEVEYHPGAEEKDEVWIRRLY